jgi:predicted Fe-Mo cluster-binding NifX family protein
MAAAQSSKLLAVVSSDGKTINGHFGRAEKFHIISLDKSGYAFVETREAESCCKEFDHSESAFERTHSLLSDCAGVIVGKIGPGATDYLLGKGMRVFEAGGFVDEVLGELVENYDRFFADSR